MIGLYPNAGHDYYLINTPLIDYICIRLDNEKKFEIIVKNLSDENIYIKSVKLNDKDYPYSTLKHKDIINGGKLIIETTSSPSDWGKEMFSTKE